MDTPKRDDVSELTSALLTEVPDVRPVHVDAGLARPQAGPSARQRGVL